MSTTIVYVIDVWKRPELTRRVLDVYRTYRENLAGKFRLELLAIGSEGTRSRELCETCGFDYMEFANRPLTAKRNAGLAAARAYDPEIVIMAGSDDVFSPNYFEVMLKMLRERPALGLRDLYFLDLFPQRLGLFAGHPSPQRRGEPIGAGRAYHRALLDEIGWSLWPPDRPANKGLDRISYENLQSRGITQDAVPMSELGVWGVDIKVGFGMHSWEARPYAKVWEGLEMEHMMQELGMPSYCDWKLPRTYVRWRLQPHMQRAVRTGRQLRKRGLSIYRQLIPARTSG